MYQKILFKFQNFSKLYSTDVCGVLWRLLCEKEEVITKDTSTNVKFMKSCLPHKNHACFKWDYADSMDPETALKIFGRTKGGASTSAESNAPSPTAEAKPATTQLAESKVVSSQPAELSPSESNPAESKKSRSSKSWKKPSNILIGQLFSSVLCLLFFYWFVMFLPFQMSFSKLLKKKIFLFEEHFDWNTIYKKKHFCRININNIFIFSIN